MQDYSEITISNKPDDNLFYQLADIIETDFKAKLINSTADLDSKYWDFKIDGQEITLHQQTFSGITLYPTRLEGSTEEENTLAEKVGFRLKYSSLTQNTWVIIRDSAKSDINYFLENVHQARYSREDYEYYKYQEYSGSCEGHDHCQICWIVISCGDIDELYTNSISTVCPNCYKRFVQKSDYLGEIEKLEKEKRLPPTQAKSNCRSWSKKLLRIIKAFPYLKN